MNAMIKTDKNRISPDIQCECLHGVALGANTYLGSQCSQCCRMRCFWLTLASLRILIQMPNLGACFIAMSLLTYKFLRFGIAPTLLHPRSKGSVKLFSADPFHHPTIVANYLEDKARYTVYNKPSSNSSLGRCARDDGGCSYCS